MEDLLNALAQLEQSTGDDPWSADAFQRILSLARVRELGPDALNIGDRNSSLPLYGSSGAKLLGELRKSLESPRLMEASWQCVGIVLCWATDVHVLGKESLRSELARRAKDARGLYRHEQDLPDGADDVLFESHLLQTMDAVSKYVIQARGVMPPFMDAFFARGLLMPVTRDDVIRRAVGVPPLPTVNPLQSLTTPKRLAVMFDSCLERFLSSLHPSTNPAAQWIAHDFSRLVTTKAGKIAIPAVVRAVLNQILSRPFEKTANLAFTGPSPTDQSRLLSFLLGSLDMNAPGDIEGEVADDLVNGGFNALQFSLDRLAGGEDADEDLLVQTIVSIIIRRWPVVFQPSALETSANILSGIEILLQRKLDAKQRLDEFCIRSLVQALIVSHTVYGTAHPSALVLQEDAEMREILVDLNFRISFLLALSSESPSEFFSIGLATKPAQASRLSDDAIRLVGLALGCPLLDSSTEMLVCKAAVAFLDRNPLETSWIFGQMALEAEEWTSRLGLWKFNLAFAGQRVRDRMLNDCARELREGARSSSQSELLLDELDRLEALYLGLDGLHTRGSIRHLQDSASFFVHFGKRKGFGQAGERFLEDCARALAEFKRYWECGNCRLMLGTCHLARKEWAAACIEYRAAVEAFEACGAYAEADAVRSSSRAFMVASDNARDWDWCSTNSASPDDRTAIAHYFLVGAAGIGDPDLTVIRCISLAPRTAFDDAISVLEHGSLRRRMHGELRWMRENNGGMVVPHFFPAQTASMEEYGFWIQRIWPLVGEETTEHSPRRFGIAGESNLVVEINTRRGLNALISAASVTIREDTLVSHHPLDVPFGWLDEADPTPKPPDHPPAVEQLNIPLPPGPPPGSFSSSSSSHVQHESSFQKNRSYQQDVDNYEQGRSEEKVRKSRSNQQNNKNDNPIQQPSEQQQQNQQQQSEQQQQAGQGEDTEAQRRKREFLKKKRERETAAAVESVPVVQVAQTPPPDVIVPQPPSEPPTQPSRPSRPTATTNSTSTERERMEEHRRQYARHEDDQEEEVQVEDIEPPPSPPLTDFLSDDDEEKNIDPHHLHHEYYEEDQEEEEEEDHVGYDEEEHVYRQANQQQQQRQTQQNHVNEHDDDSSFLLLHRRKGRLGNGGTRRVQLVDADDDMDNMLMNPTSLPKKKITLVGDYPQQQYPQQKSSSSTRRIILEDDGSAPPVKAPTTSTTAKATKTSKQRQPQPQVIVEDQQNNNIVRGKGGGFDELPPHSASRAFFNVGGARVTVEEATLVNKFVSTGEGWISATLLSVPKQTPVSVKFSAETKSMDVFVEPAFDMIESIKLSDAVTLDPLPSDASILELFDPERLAQGKGPILFSCERPELFRALVGSFRDSGLK